MTFTNGLIGSASGTEREAFNSWAILELMGHRRLAGWVSEQEIAGHGMIRIDLPAFNEDGERIGWQSSQFYSPQSLYSLIPCGEAEALAVAANNMPQPITTWDVRALLPEITESVKRDIEDEVRTEAWKKQRQVTNVYTAGYEVDEEPEEPAF